MGATNVATRATLAMLNTEKKRGYLRFLNSFVPSISVTYSNPASISAVASLMLLAVLHVHWSFSVRNRACSMLM